MRNRESLTALPWLLGGAALTALTLIFPIVGILEWGGLILLLIGVYRLCENAACKKKTAYVYGFCTVYFYYFILDHWFLNLYPLDFIGMDNAASAVVVCAGWFGLPLLQAIPGGLVFLVYRVLSRGELLDRAPLARPFVFAGLWTVFEWSSTVGWTGVPWGRLALGQIKMLPFLQSASLLGSYFVTFLMVSVAGLCAYAILKRPRAVVASVLAGSIFAANLLFGAVSMALPRKGGESLRVAIVQGNIDSHEKWGSDSYRRTVEAYGELTRQAAAEGAELIVWPETALPYDLSYENAPRKFICELARECEVTMIVGALYYDENDDYNALFLVEPDGTMREEFYAKRHLVPFGEYVPMREVIMTLIPPLAELSALGDDLSAGEEAANFETRWGEIGSLICFDSIYEELTLESVREGAELMVIASNDSWFSDSAGVYQHQGQAQLRAIESGKYVVRAANTGISTVLSPKGEVMEWIDPLEAGYRVADVEMREGRTLYGAVGNLIVYCSMLALAGLLTAELVMKKKKQK